MDGRYFRNRKYRKKKFRVRILAIKDAKHCQNLLQFMLFKLWQRGVDRRQVDDRIIRYQTNEEAKVDLILWMSFLKIRYKKQRGTVQKLLPFNLYK